MVSIVIQNIHERTIKTLVVYKRLVAIATHIAPDRGDGSNRVPSTLALPFISKKQTAEELAAKAGNSLDASMMCVRCGLQVSMSRNLACLEAILHMRCMGEVCGKRDI